MCGLAGYFGRRRPGADVTHAIIHALQPRGPDAQAHSGFDAQGNPSEDPHAPGRLIHTRLAIRELTPAGAQPMSSADKQVWLVYNGEVYDWAQYESELAAAGHPMQSRSDTEFILKGYQAWGLEKLLPRLRGMFAFALLDRQEQAVYLVRDRLGIKPLLYFHQDGELAFGSLLRSILPYLDKTERGISPHAIDAYLAHRYIPAPATILSRVTRLPAAHFARFDLNSSELEVQRYWQPDPSSERDDFATLIRQSIELRRVSDRPLGLFLSGGIDSSVIASCLEEGGNEHITAFTAAFPDTDFDESKQAARIAELLHMEQHIIPVRPDPGADFEQFIEHMDEPFADPSALPLWSLARETVTHAPVVLGGDGGDELLAGYKRYHKHKGKHWRGGLTLPRLFTPKSDQLPGKKAKILDETQMTWTEAYSLRFSGMAPSLRRWLQPGLKDMPKVHWQMPAALPKDPLLAMLEIDRLNYLPEYILRKSDLCTASHGLEARVPLLDHKLYSRTLALPADQRFTQPAKLALNAVCTPCAQLDLFKQPKRGFNPPVNDWLKGPLSRYLDDLATKLEAVSNGQIPAHRSGPMISDFRQGESRLAEQILQLLILQRSLDQIRDTP